MDKRLIRWCLAVLSLIFVSCAHLPPSASKPFVRTDKVAFEGFSEQIRKLKDSVPYQGRKSSISDAQLQPGKRTLIVLSDAEAVKSDLVTIGSIHVQDFPSGLRTLCQVVAETETDRLILIQPLDDVLAGRFEVNYAIRDDAPWNAGTKLGEGGQGVAYKWRDFAIKSASDEKQKWKRYLKLAGIDGVIKLRGFSETSQHSPSTFFELLETKDLSSVTSEEFDKIVSDLFATLRLIREIGEKHGDISPKNIMFRGGKPVFIDLGTGGVTPGYSGKVSDEVALALSLIDMRHERQFRQNALDLLNQLFKIVDPVAQKIGAAVDPQFEKWVKEKGASLQSYLVFRFLYAAALAFDKKYAPDGPALEEIEKWQKRSFTEWNERATRGLGLIIERYLHFRDMDCLTFGKVLDKKNLRLLDDLGVKPIGAYPNNAIEKCAWEILNDYKIALANAQTQVFLAGRDDDYDLVVGLAKSALDRRIYEDLEKMSPTDAMLVDLARKK